MEFQEEIEFRNRAIHLYTGNLTKLPIEDKVDVLVVSAFPGDYIPTSASLIGALKFDLDIDLQNLSTDKDEDLRASLSCWWSKELPATCAFGRVLCFEGNFKHGKTSPHAVGDLYRALVSLCNGKEFSVIMPLLATGDQGYCKPLMLTLLTETALQWMKIGLPLKLLKIVVYDRSVKQQMVETFRDVRAKWTERCRLSDHITTMKHDLYICYHPHDKEIVDSFLGELRSVEGKILVCFGDDKPTKAAFQKQIFNTMVQCARVVVFLTPDFVSDTACIDQYNIARCCSQTLERDFLLPLFVKDVTQLPAYMRMIQYIDCRFSESLQAKFRAISGDLVDWLKLSKPLIKKQEVFQFSSFEELQLDARNNELIHEEKEMMYDMFVSYSHQNKDTAHLFVETIQKFKPDWKVFFDSVGLKTGCAWQLKLYESIEKSRVFVALMSSDYVLSKVCQEEFNLALALHRDVNYSTILIQAAIEAIEKPPSWCANVPSFDFSSLDDTMLTKVQALVKAVHCLIDTTIPRPVDVLAMKPLLSTWRKLNYQKSHPYMKNYTTAHPSVQPMKCLDDPAQSLNVYLSFHPQDEYYAQLLANELRIVLSDGSTIHQSCEKDLKTLGRAAVVIPLLSHMYVSDSACMEELNLSLSIQRWADRITCCPVVLESLPLRPAYPNLCFCLFSMTDSFWMEQCLRHTIGDKLSFAEAVKLVCLRALARFISQVLDGCTSVHGSVKCILNVDEISVSIEELRQDGGKAARNPLHYFPCKSADDSVAFGGHKALVYRAISGHNSNGTHEAGAGPFML